MNNTSSSAAEIINHDAIVEICRTVTKQALALDKEADPEQFLIYPQTNNGKKRVSEQEFKILFIHALLKKAADSDQRIFISVETPTEKNYSFTGEKEMSARSDLAVFDCQRAKLCNFEFKNGSPQQRHMSIDIHKLCKEPRRGEYVIYLENSNSGTVKKLFGKLREAFNPFKLKKQFEARELRRWFAATKQKTVQIILCVGGKTPKIIHRVICKQDVDSGQWEKIFPVGDEVTISGWKVEKI